MMNDRVSFKRGYIILQYLTLCNINYQLSHNGLAVFKRIKTTVTVYSR